jgi:NAD(P)-dependent dehydrogenase (short-subunit alcohol dehydrogenase family)
MTAITSLRDKRALITGGAKRLGREVALALARDGVHIAVHFNASREPAEELSAELEGLGVRAFPVQGDLSDPGSVEPVLQTAWERLGGVDLLVNNASIFPAGTLDEMALQDLLSNITVNAWAPFLLSRALWRKIRGTVHRGSVVNLLDTRLVGGDLAHAPYHLSKAMLAELTTLMALEFAPELQVNGVAPGAALPPEGLDEAYLESLTSSLPLKRRGYPGDIAQAVRFLLNASFVTGQVIFVDGGRHIRMGGNT